MRWIFALLLTCGAAAAQEAGQYDGTLADGTTVHFVVDENPARICRA